MAVQQKHWQGPLPAPEDLRAFNDIVPGGADRIIQRWEAESQHRHRFEERALGGALFLGYQGHDWLAGTIATTTLGLVMTAFIAGKKP